MGHEHFLFSGMVLIVLSFFTLKLILKNKNEILANDRIHIVKSCFFVFIIIFLLSLRIQFLNVGSFC